MKQKRYITRRGEVYNIMPGIAPDPEKLVQEGNIVYMNGMPWKKLLQAVEKYDENIESVVNKKQQ